MRALIASLALLLSACGFQPMYGSSSGPAIGPVHVAEIEGKAGHTLKTELDRILAPGAGAGPPMNLAITLTEQLIALGLRQDESATRGELRLTANYTLTPADNGRPIRGRLLTVVNYDIPTAAFGEIAAQDDARERAAETMAQRFRAELALRMAQRRSDGAGR